MSEPACAADYLAKILRAIATIERYTADSDEPGFLSNALVRDIVIRKLAIIGDASNNVQRVAPSFAAAHQDVLWLVMFTWQNRIFRGLDTIDLALVWKTVKCDLPGLRDRIQKLLSTLQVEPGPESPSP